MEGVYWEFCSDTCKELFIRKSYEKREVAPQAEPEEKCEHGIPKMICSQGHDMVEPEESEVEELYGIYSMSDRLMDSNFTMITNKLNEVVRKLKSK